jgi:glycosyltransferase involved in cell wall biosynthesis
VKILLVHNYYGSAAPSGENAVFEMERDLLRRHGHDVVALTRHSDSIIEKPVFGTLKGALSTPWNPFAASQVRSILKKEAFDVMHVHNTFPLLSPAVFPAARGLVPRVLTLHNYRLFCPAAIPTRSGKVCTDCLDQRSVTPALRFGCYRNSRLATVPLALSVSLHRRLGTWTRDVEAFIALTDFQKEQMVKAGLPAEKVHVKPNFYPDDAEPVAWDKRGDYAVFAGRLSAEKGVETLVRAWLRWGESAPELRIVGDGELWGAMKDLVAQRAGARIRFLGRLSPELTCREIANARLLVLPSECFEGFPMVIQEAFVFGTPVAASNIGPLPDIIRHRQNGILFEAGNADSLLSEVGQIWPKDSKMRSLSLGARRTFEASYNRESNYRQLTAIYDVVTERSNRYGVKIVQERDR